MTRREQLDAEVRELVMQLGQKTYHRALLDGEISDLNQRIYKANVEALQLRQAAEAAKAELETEAAPLIEVVTP